ncbi:BZ3500_MvSof-1268-A1-R1_Chr7-3g09669 [Microbotryum saponariae]|uniref:BZ3500_MvSof-1268-A1-R1_Chr7-3g09669 protein n=1 Tax=Microbotryum saponariae TaxID=289078 RepID=A0A2X0L6N2_9BASI|nr:BZ3501_MvSof-1269-A2-R1_Chr7-2g09392 [Microbotryum saponariae]SDA02381.1 BZ3500_MvSof-1268-A1-R1_Chr7-3g09669 [Microbotryum saponariae]
MDIDADDKTTLATTSSAKATSSSTPHRQGVDHFSRLPPELQRCIFFLVRNEINEADHCLRRPICKALLAQQRAALYHSIDLRSWAQFEALFYTTLTTSPGLGGLISSLKINPTARYLELKENYEGVMWGNSDRTELEDVEIYRESVPTLRQHEVLAGFKAMTWLKDLSWVGDTGEEEEGEGENDEAYGDDLGVEGEDDDRRDDFTVGDKNDDDDADAEDPSDLLTIILSDEFARSCVPSLYRFRIIFPAGSRVTSRQLARLAPHPSLQDLAFFIPPSKEEETEWDLNVTTHPEFSLPGIRKVTIAGNFSSSRLLGFVACFTHAEKIYLCPERGDQNLVPYIRSLSTQLCDLAIVCSQYMAWDYRSVDVFDETLARFTRLRHLSLEGTVQLTPVFWESIVQLPSLESIVFEKGTEPRYEDLVGFLTSPQRPAGVLQTLALNQYRAFRMGSRLEVGDSRRINDYFARLNGPSVDVATTVLLKGWIMPEWREGFIGFRDAEKLLGLIGETGVRITGSFFDALVTTRVFLMLWERVREAEQSGGTLAQGLEALPDETDEQCFNRYGMMYIRSLLGDKGWELMQKSWFG